MVISAIIFSSSGCGGFGNVRKETDTHLAAQRTPSSGGDSKNAPDPTCKFNAPESDPGEKGPFRLTLSRAEVRAGEEITMSIDSQQPVSIERGVDSYLECWNGKVWLTNYLLVSTHFSDKGPTAHPYPGDVGYPLIGIPGPGPERIRLPGDLKPGWYQIRKAFRVQDGKSSVPHTAYGRLQVVP